MGGQGKGKGRPSRFPRANAFWFLSICRQGINNAPPDFTSALGTKIENHLFKYNAAANLVAEDRLTALEARNPEEFAKMGVADVARAVDADVVIYVDVVTMNVAATTDANSLSGATSQCFIKVIDANGNRMWPSSETSGELITGSIEPALSENRSEAQLMDELQDQLTIRIGRLFHPYSRDDKEMTQ